MIRNMPIRTKLFAILVAPLIALTVLASVGIGTSLARKVQAEHLTDEAAVVVGLSQLVHELQQERDLSAGWVAGGRTVGRGDVVAQRAAVDKVLASVRRDIEGLEVHESPFHEQVALALPELNKLSDGRQAIEDNSSVTVSSTLDHYSGIISKLLAAYYDVASETNDRALVGRVAAFAALARFKEAISLERGLLNAVAVAGRFDPGESQRLPTIVGLEQAWRSQFDATASPEQRASLDQALQSSEARPASELRNTVLISSPEGPVDLDPDR